LSQALAMKRIKETRGAEWPPRLFETKVEAMLRKKLGVDYSVNNISHYLDVTPVTMRKILKGCTISLENAMKLAELLGKDIKEIWKLKK